MKRVAVAAALLAMPSPSLAASPVGVGTPIEGPSTPTTGLEPGNRRALWSRGAHRWFLSSTIDAGYLYLRPQIYRARVGYALRLGEQAAMRLGPVVDVVHIPGRSATIIRGGLIATVVLTHQVEALATIIPTFVSPDRIGVAGGDFAQLGIRYRWATPGPPQDD